MSALITERDVERRFRQEGEKRGAIVAKLTSPGNSGMPDRIVALPGGRACFAEIKAPGKRLRPLQCRMFAKLKRLGHTAVVIDSLEEAVRFWELLDGSAPKGQAR